MGILECASGASIWRGYDYYHAKKVVNLEEIEANVFTAKVLGNSSEPYSVELHVDHPRKSKCNCAHADGKRIICKHIVAAYFTVLPEEADRFYAEAMAYQKEEEKRQEALADQVCHYVRHPYVKHTTKNFSLHLNFLQVQFLFLLTFTQKCL